MINTLEDTHWRLNITDFTSMVFGLFLPHSTHALPQSFHGARSRTCFGLSSGMVIDETFDVRLFFVCVVTFFILFRCHLCARTA
jgi:hypothetical protein